MTKLRILGVAVLLATTGVACASGDSSVKVAAAGPQAASLLPRNAVLAAAKTVDVAPTGRFTVTATIGSGKYSTFTVQGAFDRARKAVQVETVGAKGSKFAGFGTVTVDGVVYLKLGGAASMLGLKTPWVSLDVAGFAAKHKIKLPTAGPGATGGDPQSFLDLLKGLSGSVTKVGTESVRGTATTHYKAQILPAKALAKLPAARQKKIRDAIGDEPLDTPIPVDVWVDGDGHFRKGTFHEDVKHLGPISTTVEYFDIGKPVTITVPTKGQVTRAEDIPALKDLLGGN